MPTYRKLYYKIVDSYDFAEMPDDFTRVFWMLLTVTADSEGRMIDNPAWLRAKMFPLRTDVTDEQIESALQWLAGRKMIVRYEVNGRKYFAVINFKIYQTGTEREAKSVLPAPPVTHEEVMSNEREGQELVKVAATATVYESVNASASVSVEQQENAFALLEKINGRPLSAFDSDNLADLEKQYSEGVVKAAVVEAGKSAKGRVNIKYIESILKRWKDDGVGPFETKRVHVELQAGPLPDYLEAA